MPTHLLSRRSIRCSWLGGQLRLQLIRLAWVLPVGLVLCGGLSSNLLGGNPPPSTSKGSTGNAGPKSTPGTQPLLPGQNYVAPQQPPVPFADPSVRRTLKVQVPTRLKVVKKGDVLEISIDPDSMKPAEITVGLNMLLGLKNEYRWRFAGDTKVQATNSAYSGGGSPESLDLSIGTSQQKYVPGAKVVIELVISVFETDIPPGMFWAPQSGQYQELWTGTLSQNVE